MLLARNMPIYWIENASLSIKLQFLQKDLRLLRLRRAGTFAILQRLFRAILPKDLDLKPGLVPGFFSFLPAPCPAVSVAGCARA